VSLLKLGNKTEDAGTFRCPGASLETGLPVGSSKSKIGRDNNLLGTEISMAASGLKKIRYAVVGLGHIAQAAVLPAFQHASRNSQLVAFVSEDPQKVEQLGKQYGVESCWPYEQYDKCLNSGQIDAVYISLPNNMHEEFTIRAAKAKVHVLCEKPMAPGESACQNMIAAARASNVKLMIAYRLHFDEANMEVVELVKSGKIGEARIFNSLFTMQVRKGNIRTRLELAGGPLYDMGIYCVNAARHIFQSEPHQVIAMAARSEDERFDEVDEMLSVSLKFPLDRIANFVCSFGVANSSRYQVLGTKGEIAMEPAYDYAEDLKYRVTLDGTSEERRIAKHDQFAAELIHFSNSILQDIQPRPSGEEGLADVRIMNAIETSARVGQAIDLEPVQLAISRPGMDTVIVRPPVHKASLVNAQPPQA
jgi:glucose-fructose oxidoreductase